MLLALVQATFSDVARLGSWAVGPNIPARFVMLGFAVMIGVLGKDRPEAILFAFLIATLFV